jgi:predicted DCC family thiol-disulfide oxidoreductase YuxK
VDTVLFDGNCVFCTRGAKTLKRLDVFGSLELLSLHDPSVAQRYPDLSHDQLMEEMWVVGANGKRYAGAASFAYLSRRLPLLFPLFPILNFPFMMPLWRLIYRNVAKRRYLISGQTCENGSCSLHGRKDPPLTDARPSRKREGEVDRTLPLAGESTPVAAERVGHLQSTRDLTSSKS